MQAFPFLSSPSLSITTDIHNVRQFTWVILCGKLIASPFLFCGVVQPNHLISIFSLWREIGGNCPECQNNCAQLSAHVIIWAGTKTLLHHAHLNAKTRTFTENTNEDTQYLHIQEKWVEEDTQRRSSQQICRGVWLRGLYEKLFSSRQEKTLIQTVVTTFSCGPRPKADLWVRQVDKRGWRWIVRSVLIPEVKTEDKKTFSDIKFNLCRFSPPFVVWRWFLLSLHLWLLG